tara:strand:+ start:390 stop:917 length:528 start_codon:yes stop_codon:yes gene_type:complete
MYRPIIASVAILLTLSPGLASANPIFTFSGITTIGVSDLIGEPLTGSVTLDENLVTDMGLETFTPTTGILDLSFTFFGNTFVAEDDKDTPGGPFITLMDGEVTGFTFLADVNPSLGLNLGNVGRDAFVAITERGFSGGEILSITREDPVDPSGVPVPGTLALLGFGLLGLTRRRK